MLANLHHVHLKKNGRQRERGCGGGGVKHELKSLHTYSGPGYLPGGKETLTHNKMIYSYEVLT